MYTVINPSPSDSNKLVYNAIIRHDQKVFRISLTFSTFWSFFWFCLIWALGGSNIGQKTRGRLIKVLRARRTYFWRFFGQPFGASTSSANAPQNQISLIQLPPTCIAQRVFPVSCPELNPISRSLGPSKQVGHVFNCICFFCVEFACGTG